MAGQLNCSFDQFKDIFPSFGALAAIARMSAKTKN
jgi:hypothetical protein